MATAYDEFGLFHENAAEWGLAYAGPPTVRREEVVTSGEGGDVRLSALVWGMENDYFGFAKEGRHALRMLGKKAV